MAVGGSFTCPFTKKKVTNLEELSDGDESVTQRRLANGGQSGASVCVSSAGPESAELGPRGTLWWFCSRGEWLSST